jgi:DNA-binding transcriptional regulator YiaG
MSDGIPRPTEAEFARAMPWRQRECLMKGEFRGGEDVVALRRFTRLTQQAFVGVHTLRNGEQGRSRPEGPALALLRITARHPRTLQENLAAKALPPPVPAPAGRPPA